MLEHLDLVAKVLMSLGVVGVTTWQVWGLTVTVRDMVKTVKNDNCRLNALETNILEEIKTLQDMGREAGRNADRRFDRIEKRLTYLFGKTNTTIPPND